MSDQFAFLLPMIMLTFGCAFLIVWRSGVRPAGSWGIGYVCAGLAYAAPVVLASLPQEPQTILADALFAVAFFFFGEALLIRFACPRLTGVRLACSAAAVAASVYTVLVSQSLRAELVASDVSCAALILLPLCVIGRRVRRPIDLAIFAIVGLTVLDNLARSATIVLTTSSDDLSSFMSTEYAYLMQASGAVLGLAFGMTALAAVTLDVVNRYRDEALTDVMTRLLNRRGFEQATAALPGASRLGSVVTCDIDHFKRVNDTFGHAAGDQVIIGFAEIIRALLPPCAIASRVGGEEFILYLPNCGATEAEIFANRIRTAMAARDWTGTGVSGSLTASFGVSVIGRSDTSIHDALIRADESLYRAKAEGRDRVSMTPVLQAA